MKEKLLMPPATRRYNARMAPLHCDSCRREIEVGSGYCVKMEVFADGQTPPLHTDSAGGESEIAELLEQMREMSAEELQDGVYRAFEFRLCPACHREFLCNPLGLPRRAIAGRN